MIRFSCLFYYYAGFHPSEGASERACPSMGPAKLGDKANGLADEQRDARISRDSSAARELKEDLFKPSRKKKKNELFFSSHTYQEEAHPLHHFLLSSLLSSIWGC